MANRKPCANFAWRDEDSTYQAERANDRIVFRKIAFERGKGRKVKTVIRNLFREKLWAPRMTGKTAESWRVNFYRRAKRREKV